MVEQLAALIVVGTRVFDVGVACPDSPPHRIVAIGGDGDIAGIFDVINLSGARIVAGG